ncbi:MAG: glycosyltransferase [Candidatus Dadabacteria bacterium]|nr:MAG: glycosyltransferase [Candidatus Dadabacteria bacterium]
MLEVIFITGVFGLLGMTWLFPLGAAGFSRLIFCSKERRTPQPDSIKSIAVLIPAHNEEQKLAATLKSINAALIHMRFRYPQVSVKLVVGADGCSDNTSRIALEHSASLISCREQLGKWQMLRMLAESVPGFDWIIFADSGVIWQEDFLTRLVRTEVTSNVAAICPTYQRNGSGLVQQRLWALERHFKTIEEKAGGPVTAHGATVVYRRRPVLKLLRVLSENNWLNDDVVLPLLVRTLNPAYRVRYQSNLGVIDPDNKRRDCGRELTRRLRIVAGNVQWIRELFPLVFKANPVVALVALRRIFRLFWAYWLLMVCVPLFLAFSLKYLGLWPVTLSVLTVTAMGYLLVRTSRTARMLSEAALASLLAPYYFIFNRKLEVIWR